MKRRRMKGNKRKTFELRIGEWNISRWTETRRFRVYLVKKSWSRSPSGREEIHKIGRGNQEMYRKWDQIKSVWKEKMCRNRIRVGQQNGTDDAVMDTFFTIGISFSEKKNRLGTRQFGYCQKDFLCILQKS